MVLSVAVVAVVAGVAELRCPRCGYEWTPRVEKPKRCPRCGRWLPPWKG